MNDSTFQVPKAINEPVKGYAPGSPERAALTQALNEAKAEQRDIPMYIGGKEIREGEKIEIRAPHNHDLKLGHFYKSTTAHVESAIQASLTAKAEWEATPFEHRAAIFLKAAELLAGPMRMRMNAATMLGQSKNCYQAEIDAACEFIDFLRFNVQFATDIYKVQPESAPGIWNRLEYRPLEGFVFALTPFNFTSIAGNLPFSAALMGNTVVWKPSNTQVYSAQVIMELFQAAGLPDGVINLIYPSGPDAGKIIFSHPDFTGIHFTGSTGVFQGIWKEIGNNIATFKSYPRIVGETGGKDFIVIHPSAEVKGAVSSIVRGAFEYQGQKCSAASRVYIPTNLWAQIKEGIEEFMHEVKVGDVEDYTNFMNAVIDEKSYNKLNSVIEAASKESGNTIITPDAKAPTNGYYVNPTIIVTKDPKSTTMCEELFGPVLTVYLYEPEQWVETLKMVDSTSPYALTGAVLSTDRYAIVQASEILRHSAGNFYINDKPTGAVVGQQPFGGARASGTNDKAGSYLNLIRWTSPRAIKETFVTPNHYGYPFLGK